MLKNAAKRFVLPTLAILIMICPQAWGAPQGLDLVVAVDLSRSVDQRGPDGQAAFAKNIAAGTE